MHSQTEMAFPAVRIAPESLLIGRWNGRDPDNDSCMPFVVKNRMKRTLLAIGVAVLASLTLMPWGYGGETAHFTSELARIRGLAENNAPDFFSVHEIRQLLPFFISPPDSFHFGLLWREFILEMIFLSVLAAVIVNIPWRRGGRKNYERD
jgi:hypothetical protein